MTHPVLSPLIGPEFDKFLGASIGEDRNGTALSVLSALARLEVDPWQEATTLARMPSEAAAARLTALIDSLSDEPTSAITSKSAATALVALLPKGKGAGVRPSASSPAATGADQAQIILALSAFAVIILIVITTSALFSAEPGTGAKQLAGRGGEAAMVVPSR